MALDLDTSNGTRLNGEYLDRPRRLQAGDTLQLGRHRLELQTTPNPRQKRTVRQRGLSITLNADEQEVARALVEPYLRAGSFAARPATRGEIAELLHVSPRTVQRRFDALALKLKVESDGGRERPRLIADRVIALGLHQQR